MQRHVIGSMARREVASRYIGSLFGFVWTFVQPAVLIFVFWVVFDIGFRIQPKDDVPFIVWLTAGMAGWFVFSDILNGSVNTIVANANLVKKTLFPPAVLPIVSIVSSMITHSIFLIMVLGLIILQQMTVSLYFLQFVYYLFSMAAFALGLGWAVAALNVFVRDICQAVGIILQVGFWATPILWDIEMMPLKVQFLFKLNPMFYIVQGYRESFIYFIPFWRHPVQTVYYWGITISTLCIGAYIFKKLKPQFADVL